MPLERTQMPQVERNSRVIPQPRVGVYNAATVNVERYRGTVDRATCLVVTYIRMEPFYG